MTSHTHFKHLSLLPPSPSTTPAPPPKTQIFVINQVGNWLCYCLNYAKLTSTEDDILKMQGWHELRSQSKTLLGHSCYAGITLTGNHPPTRVFASFSLPGGGAFDLSSQPGGGAFVRCSDE